MLSSSAATLHVEHRQMYDEQAPLVQEINSLDVININNSMGHRIPSFNQVVNWGKQAF